MICLVGFVALTAYIEQFIEILIVTAIVGLPLFLVYLLINKIYEDNREFSNTLKRFNTEQKYDVIFNNISPCIAFNKEQKKVWIIYRDNYIEYKQATFLKLIGIG